MSAELKAELTKTDLKPEARCSVMGINRATHRHTAKRVIDAQRGLHREFVASKGKPRKANPLDEQHGLAVRTQEGGTPRRAGTAAS